METRSGESIFIYATRQAEGIFAPFDIFRGITIYPGEYWFTRYSAEVSTFRGRKVWIQSRYASGSFFDGTSNDLALDVNIRSSRFVQFTVQNTYTKSEFEQGGFSVLLCAVRMRYALNPNLFGFILAQYNSATDEYLINYRLQWIPFSGADFYFIANQLILQNENGQLAVNALKIMGKLIWRFVI